MQGHAAQQQGGAVRQRRSAVRQRQSAARQHRSAVRQHLNLNLMSLMSHAARWAILNLTSWDAA